MSNTMLPPEIPLVILNGPTAVGKSEIAVELAERLDGEIISADSMQVYRGLNIGTAKIRPEETKGIPHHMIDIIDPEEEFGVFTFKQMAKRLISDIYSRGKLPIIAGGTGFYIQAVLYDIDFSDYDGEVQSAKRAELERKLAENGSIYMHEYLRKIDPESAKIIHPNNIKKLIHAIEFYEITGTKISEHNASQAMNESPYKFLYYVITDSREEIYNRINHRVDKMMATGLEEEVRGLLENGCTENMQSMLGIGYKEMVDYLKGRTTREEAIENIKRETRHFAKKQLTWFKREKKVEFVDRRNYLNTEAIVDELEKKIREYFLNEKQ